MVWQDGNRKMGIKILNSSLLYLNSCSPPLFPLSCLMGERGRKSEDKKRDNSCLLIYYIFGIFCIWDKKCSLIE